MLLNDTAAVRPYNPARFVGQIAYDGATEIKVAALAVHPKGGVALLNLVGNDTAISSRVSTLFLGEAPIEFIPDAELTWNGPRLLSRLSSRYKQTIKRLPGIRNTANWMITTGNLRIKFNLENPPQIPEELIKKNTPENGDKPQVLTVKTEEEPTYRYVVATLNDGEEPMPSYGAVIGTLVGMRAIILRPRQEQTNMIARQWADALWKRGLEKGLVKRLPSAGIAAWAMENSLLRWNNLVSEGVTAGWLPVPRRTLSPVLPHPVQSLVINDTTRTAAAD